MDTYLSQLAHASLQVSGKAGELHILASADSYGKVWLWDVRTRKQIGAPLKSHTALLSNWVALSADGRTLASVSDDRTVRLWAPTLWSTSLTTLRDASVHTSATA